MDYVNVGRTGLKVSRICLGCLSFGLTERRWGLSEDQSRPIIKRAIEGGINFFDTANTYGHGASEQVLGRAVQDYARRDEVVIATKVYYPMRADPNGRGLSRKAVMAEVEGSLRRLNTDYIDLYQIHRWDDATPIEETLDSLHDVVKSGKVRYIGASSMAAWQFCKALQLAGNHRWTHFVSMQPHYNLLYREEEREMLPLCESEGVGVLPWSPLAGGRLARSWQEEPDTLRGRTDDLSAGNYARTQEADKIVVDRLTSLSQKRGLPHAQLALAWLLSKPVVTAPIVGVTKPQHLEDAFAAVGVKLLEDEVKLLEAPYVPHSVSGL
ncbi:aldo/keto reductase [Mesorhizobium sp. M0006]|uniref:aldo/keto reductase n=1 Tax=Mesorhizobium sp. M0006 TaxID=2956838 RepID=UPI0033383E23